MHPVVYAGNQARSTDRRLKVRMLTLSESRPGVQSPDEIKASLNLTSTNSRFLTNHGA